MFIALFVLELCPKELLSLTDSDFTIFTFNSGYIPPDEIAVLQSTVFYIAHATYFFSTTTVVDASDCRC